MRAAHDKCGNLQVNTGELICMLKATFSTDVCRQRQSLKMINAM